MNLNCITESQSFAQIFVRLIIFTLTAFLPLSAISYFWFRRDRSQLEAKRVLKVLAVDPDYSRVYAIDKRHPKKVFCALACASLYATLITLIGLIILFLGKECHFSDFYRFDFGGSTFPKPGSRIIFGIAFLGAYVWGVQYIFQRYSQNDLTHTIYYNLGLRMIFASSIALLVYSVADGLVDKDLHKLISSLAPAIAFLIGMFPQRGLRWVSERLPMFASTPHPSVREAPLEMIEGIGGYDGLRLEELGIKTCYDLATADFVPLVLNTPYSARQLVDWILQAKLCTCFGEGVTDLRKHGVRLISDLANLSDAQLADLSSKTVVTESALQQARETVKIDLEIRRMCRVSEMLSRYTQLEFQRLDANSSQTPQESAIASQSENHVESSL